MRLFNASQATRTYKTQATAIKRLETALKQWDETLEIDDCHWLIGTNDEGRYFAVVQMSSFRCLNRNPEKQVQPGFLVDCGIRVMN